MSLFKKPNPFAKLDSTLTEESIGSIVHHFGEIADHLKKCWSSLSPVEQSTILSSAEDIGTKLAMGAASSMMTGDMSDVATKLKNTLGKSTALTAIFKALTNG